MTDTLGPNDIGLWEIETQGSVHRWRITDGVVETMRLPFDYSKAVDYGIPGGFEAYNEVWQHPSSVAVWPEVGGVFALNFMDGRWHRSSTIKSIKKVVSETCSHCGATLVNEDCPNYGFGPEHA